MKLSLSYRVARIAQPLASQQRIHFAAGIATLPLHLSKLHVFIFLMLHAPIALVVSLWPSQNIGTTFPL